MRRQALALIFASAIAAPALASSDGAWAQFAADVQAKCLAAAAPLLTDAKAVVDPTGSESFGLAVLTGKAKGTDATVSHICVYDKKAKTVELGSELPSDALKVELPGSTKP